MINFIEEFEKLIDLASPASIVQGEKYLYYCLSPTLDTARYLPRVMTPSLALHEIVNQKGVTVGYWVMWTEDAVEVRLKKDFGAALYFGPPKEHYDDLHVLYADSFVKVLEFDRKDYFVSIKWKASLSNQSESGAEDVGDAVEVEEP